MSTTVERDARFDAFIKRLQETKRTEVFIGLLGSGKAQAPHGDGTITQVDVGTWNEFGVEIDGVEHVPERSFLRATIDIKHKDITKRAATELQKAFLGKQSVGDAYERIGIAVVGMVQKRISDGIAPGNAEVTMQRKGSSTPLIDTGQLRSAVTYEVKS